MKKKKGELDFWKIFGQSWNEYRVSFKEIFKFVFVFVGIMSLLLSAWSYYWYVTNSSVKLLVDNPNLLFQGQAFPAAYITGTFLIGIFSLLLQFFVYAGFYGTVVKKEKLNYNNLVKNAKVNFWKFVLFAIVISIFLILLGILFIVPAIIFGVFWVFAVYILFDEKVKIIESLKRSFNLVKGKWWKTFGYIVLFILISIGIIIIAGLVLSPFNMVIGLIPSTGSVVYAFKVLVNYVGNLVSPIVIMPLAIIFFRNFYLGMKKK